MFRSFGNPFFSESPTLFDQQPSFYSPYDSYYRTQDPFSPYVDLRQPQQHPRSRAPHHQQQQQQQHPRQRSAGYYGGLSPREIEILKAREAAEIRAREAREAELRAREQELAELKAKQKRIALEKRRLLQKYNKAAATIQRTWREHHQKCVAARKANAAKVIQRTLKAYPHIKDAKLITTALKQLRVKQEKLKDIESQFHSKRWTYRELLGIQDQIERLVISLDQVESYGKDAVRIRRKEIVQYAESILHEVDAQLFRMRKCAVKIQRFVRNWQQSRRQQRQNEAASVIQQVVRNYPVVKKAKLDVQELKKTRKIQQEYLKARQEFLAALKRFESELLNGVSNNDFIVNARKQLLSDMGKDLSFLGNEKSTDENSEDSTLEVAEESQAEVQSIVNSEAASADHESSLKQEQEQEQQVQLIADQPEVASSEH